MNVDGYDFVVEELRPGVLRLTDHWWPHDCDDFDMVGMVLSHGRQGSVPSEDPADWHDWRSTPLRVVGDRVERWVSEAEWHEQHDVLVDWVERSRQAFAIAPNLSEYTNPNEASDALKRHQSTRPGWFPVRDDFGRAVLDYIDEKGLSIVNPVMAGESGK